MDNSVETDTQPAQELTPVELQPPERERVRRKLVQSTLFPHITQPQDRVENGNLKGERNCNEGEDSEDEDEDYCGSQSQSKRKRKGKPKKTMPTKNACAKKTENRSGNTPKKDLKNSMSQKATVVIPDLRLEERMNAQENSRMFAGRKVHPFFSSWKTGKKNQEVTEAEGASFPVCRKNKEITCGPIHVFERTQDDGPSLDWRIWTFSEEFSSKSSCVQESNCSSIFEGSVECLSFDKLTFVPDLNTTPMPWNEVSSDQCLIQQECISQTVPDLNTTPMLENEASSEQGLTQQERLYQTVRTIIDISNDERQVCNQSVKEGEESKTNIVDSFCGNTISTRKLEIQHQSRFLEERMMSYYSTCGCQSRDDLWTYKYQPKRAMEVCGNDESVRFLSEWLQQWRERDVRINKDFVDSDKVGMQDMDYICSGSDTESESKDEVARLKNVLLVTGPVGCGKSAAIYACAQEQGFEVLEVNASECRNGAVVKQRFGEALESRSLKRSLANPVGLQNKHIVNHPSALANGAATLECDDEVVELISSLDEEFQNATSGSPMFDCAEIGSLCHQHGAKHLILFEDVDINFLEDRGFLAAVQRIAETAKGPIVLTSNGRDPLLPEKLDRVQLCFQQPLPKELLCHIYMVCASERANIEDHLLERFIGCCKGDIRKTIMQLQFWCQGGNSRKDKKTQRAYGSQPFDLEAGHQILPKLMPWGLPCLLSELVEKQVINSLSMEENPSLMEVIEKEELDTNETHSFMHNNEAEIMEAKKEAMLSMNGSINDYDEFTAQHACVEFSDDSDTPFPCFRRSVQRKHDVVQSSESEDDFSNNRCEIVSDRDNNNEALPQGSPLFKEVHCPVVADIDDKHYQCSGAVDSMPVNDGCNSADVSCVPESSFVPETEFNYGTELISRTVSCNFVGDTVEEVSVSNRLPVEAENVGISNPEIYKCPDTLVSNHYAIAEFPQQEEVENSESEEVESVPEGYQVMDESSRMDFKRLSKCLKRPKSMVVTDLAQKAWNKLRSYRPALAQYITSEQRQALQIVKLTHKLSNLISETDVLLSNCQPITSDCLEPSTIPLEEPNEYSLYDKLQLASTTVEHGFCFYSKDISAVVSTKSSVNTLDLTSEMFAATKGMMALGKLARQDTGTSSSFGKNSDLDQLQGDKSENKFDDLIHSIVPSKSCLAMKGVASLEYLSALRTISRSEASRISENVGKIRRKRRRSDQHYLSSKLMLSPEEISMLDQNNLQAENCS